MPAFVLAGTAAAVLSSTQSVPAQHLPDRCDPVTEVLVVRAGGQNIFPSAGIAETLGEAEVTVICLRPGQSTAVQVWQAPITCTGASTVVSWRNEGRIRVNCAMPAPDADASETQEGGD
ncbi:hypothetical protein FMN50_07770 [Rhodobacterales bacterium]|nr:hypothetical protein FMN50_07770 [Rhodobacterales bacterium]